MAYKLLVFISGEGTNLQAIIDACVNRIINAEIVAVISNKNNAYGLERAKISNIKSYYIPYITDKISRNNYDYQLAKFINKIDFDLIILAGWMHILGSNFLSNIKQPIINLHPALPGQFPGKDAIKYAYNAFKLGKVNKTGIMVHKVVEEIDAGEIIETLKIPILSDDTEDILRQRIRYYEKFILIHSIQKILLKINDIYYSKKFIYNGKVRDIYEGSDAGTLIIVSSDRQSAFDQHICNIPHKGEILTNVSGWWFKQTADIIDNHYISHKNNKMLVKKCVPFKVEVVVRGYITGNTKTSLWTHYSQGIRHYCGHQFRDGYQKNQQLDENVVTPTTKGDSDEPISGTDVVKMNIMTEDEWKYVESVALKLFEYGQRIADDKGLILVDTKYEFGRNIDGKIILIDELHTCDSSRYWLKESYLELILKGEEPERFDKDIVREWIRERCNPYEEELPEIPDRLISIASESYRGFYKILVD